MLNKEAWKCIFDTNKLAILRLTTPMYFLLNNLPCRFIIRRCEAVKIDNIRFILLWEHTIRFLISATKFEEFNG